MAETFDPSVVAEAIVSDALNRHAVATEPATIIDGTQLFPVLLTIGNDPRTHGSRLENVRSIRTVGDLNTAVARAIEQSLTRKDASKTEGKPPRVISSPEEIGTLVGIVVVDSDGNTQPLHVWKSQQQRESGEC